MNRQLVEFVCQLIIAFWLILLMTLRTNSICKDSWHKILNSIFLFVKKKKIFNRQLVVSIWKVSSNSKSYFFLMEAQNITIFFKTQQINCAFKLKWFELISKSNVCCYSVSYLIEHKSLTLSIWVISFRCQYCVSKNCVKINQKQFFF